MILKAFSIRDSKGEIYHPPFYKPTHGLAEREFQDLTKDDKSQVNKHPEDFDLFHIGEYDDQSGKFTSLATPQHMIKAIDLTNR